jgi:hypothetical protein
VNPPDSLTDGEPVEVQRGQPESTEPTAAGPGK